MRQVSRRGIICKVSSNYSQRFRIIGNPCKLVLNQHAVKLCGFLRLSNLNEILFIINAELHEIGFRKNSLTTLRRCKEILNKGIPVNLFFIRAESPVI